MDTAEARVGGADFKDDVGLLKAVDAHYSRKTTVKKSDSSGPTITVNMNFPPQGALTQREYLEAAKEVIDAVAHDVTDEPLELPPPDDFEELDDADDE